MRQHICGNSKCRTTITPLWRKGWVTKEGRAVMLCNACGLHFKKGHYCSFCNQIYRESDADDITNPWIGCDRCSRWVHKKCEEVNGVVFTPGVPYLCPDCRNLRDSLGDNQLFQSTFPNTKKRRRKPSTQTKNNKRRKSSVQIMSTFTFNNNPKSNGSTQPTSDQIIQAALPSINNLCQNMSKDSFKILKFKTNRHERLPSVKDIWTHDEKKLNFGSNFSQYQEEGILKEEFVSDSSCGSTPISSPLPDAQEEELEIFEKQDIYKAPNTTVELKVDLSVLNEMFNAKFRKVTSLSKLGSLWAVCESELQAIH
jgi:hypothetical protein